RRRHSAEGAREFVQGVSRLDQKGRHGSRPRHRRRTRAGAWRHTDACRRLECRAFPHRAAGPFPALTRAAPFGELSSFIDERIMPGPRTGTRALRLMARATRERGFAAPATLPDGAFCPRAARMRP